MNDSPRTKTKRFLILSGKGQGTGCALRALYIAEALRRKGHIVHFPKPIPSLPVWADMALSTFYYFAYSLFISSNVAFCVKPYPMSVPALYIQRLKGAKVIFDVDDLDYDYSQGAMRSFHQWLQRPWPRWADGVTYHNPKLKEALIGSFQVDPSRIRQLPQGVDFSIFNTKSLETLELPPGIMEWKSSQKGLVLCFTAHLNVACDLGPALEAFRLLLASHPQARLLVAGGGPDEHKFKALAASLGISNSVYFTGFLSPRQVAACLKLSDAALVYYSDTPVNAHRSSMKLRESLACGVKVIATRVGDSSAWKKGLFLSEPDPKSFAETVGKALKAKKSPREVALLVKKWGWEACVESLEKDWNNP
jgi:glycosyltransferase involved in cell wall biosynthesis